jgi:hypothetical protein
LASARASHAGGLQVRVPPLETIWNSHFLAVRPWAQIHGEHFEERFCGHLIMPGYRVASDSCIDVTRLRLLDMPFPQERFLLLQRSSFQAAYSLGRIVEAPADDVVGVDWLRDRH